MSTVLHTGAAPAATPKSTDRIHSLAIPYLNEHVPGWRERVNPECLNMEACDYCVLGQLFGDYADGREALGLTRYEARDLGFDFAQCSDETYPELTQAWREELANG